MTTKEACEFCQRRSCQYGDRCKFLHQQNPKPYDAFGSRPSAPQHNGPCDIVGDKSYEELRAVSYEDAKSGLCLEAIVERERFLLLAKLVQFNRLLTFRKLGMRPSAPPPSVSGTVTITSESKGLFGSQFPIQPLGGSFSSVAANNSTTGTVAELNTFHTSEIMPPAINFANSQSSIFPNGMNAASFELTGSNANQNLIVEMPKVNAGGCNSIWFKEEWFPGEIPEATPPDESII